MKNYRFDIHNCNSNSNTRLKECGRHSTFVRGWYCTGPHQPRCAIVQLETQAIHFSAHRTVHGQWITTSDQRWVCLSGTQLICRSKPRKKSPSLRCKQLFWRPLETSQVESRSHEWWTLGTWQTQFHKALVWPVGALLLWTLQSPATCGHWWKRTTICGVAEK